MGMRILAFIAQLAVMGSGAYISNGPLALGELATTTGSLMSLQWRQWRHVRGCGQPADDSSSYAAEASASSAQHTMEWGGRVAGRSLAALGEGWTPVETPPVLVKLCRLRCSISQGNGGAWRSPSAGAVAV